MRALSALLAELSAAGVVVWEDNGRLAYRAPRGVLGPELLAELRAHKQELLDALRLTATQPALRPRVPASRPAHLPLSSAQQRLWFLDQLEGANPAFNVLGALRLEGPLHLQALERSLNELVRRHESLRTTFVVEPAPGETGRAADSAEPRQLIGDFAPFPLPVIELRAATPTELLQAEQRQLAAEAARRFDLRRGPLYHFSLLRLQQSDAAGPALRHALLINLHHIVVDEWSIRVLFRELQVLYEAFAQGRPSPLPALALQYADWACSEREWLDSAASAPAEQYWRAQLRELPSCRLPPDHPPPAQRSYAGTCYTQLLPTPLLGALRQLSQRHGATLFMTCAAALGYLVHYYTGEPEVVLGTNVANREDAALQPLIGFFTNQVILRTSLHAAPSFLTLLARVREATLAAQQHQRYPIHRLAAELGGHREEGLATPFHIKFEYVEGGLGLVLADLQVTPLELTPPLVRESLGVVLRETVEGLRLEIGARRDRYLPASITRLGQLFAGLLGLLAAEPAQTLAELGAQVARLDQELRRQRSEELRVAAQQRLKPRRRDAAAAPAGPDGREP